MILEYAVEILGIIICFHNMEVLLSYLPNMLCYNPASDLRGAWVTPPWPSTQIKIWQSGVYLGVCNYSKDICSKADKL